MKYTHTVRACYVGYITQAIVNNLAPLLFVIFKDEFGIPISGITLLITINFLIQLLVDFLSAKFVDKIGYRVCIVAAHIFCAAGLFFMGVLPRLTQNAYPSLLFSAVLYAVGGGLIEVLISPILEACPSESKAAAMSLLHSFYCWGTVAVVLLSTIFLNVFDKENWAFLPVLWALLPIFNAVLFSQVPINSLTAEGEGQSLLSLVSNRLFWVFFILMIASGASEMAMSQWASFFAESSLGISKALGDIFGICLFAALMGCSRAFYGVFGDRINLQSFIGASGVLCVISYFLAALSKAPFFSLLGCALCGLSVGIMWPGVFSLSSASIPKGGTAMFALLALAGDLGCSSGPTLVGFVSGVFGDNLKSGLLLAAAFPIAVIILGSIINVGVRQCT